MPLFRDFTPKRRDIKTVVTSYRDYKSDLRIDFKERCGYCNSLDTWKLTYYEVDHFIPEAILTIKSNTDYSNLIYSCRSCNNAKRKKWPSGDENVPNINDEGWIEPCDDSYKEQFSRTINGEIKYETALGKWMYYALKLNKPQHQIIYNLEVLRSLIMELEKLNEKINNPIIEKLLLNTYRGFVNYIDQFKAL